MILKIKRKFQIILIAVDLLLIYISFFLASWLRFGSAGALDRYSYILDYTFYIIICIYFLILYLMDIYNVDRIYMKRIFFAQYIGAFTGIGIIIAGLFYLFPDIKYGRGLWLGQLGFSFIFLLAWRYIFDKITHSGYTQNKIAIIGINEAGREIAEIINKTRYYTFSGFITEGSGAGSGKNQKVLGNSSDLADIINKNKVNALVISSNTIKNKKLERDIIDAKMSGVSVYDVPMIFEYITNRIPVKYINDFWIIIKTFSGIKNSFYNSKFKRFVDLAGSICGLMVTSPVLIITSLLIKATSKGPVLYRQIRVGLNDKHFSIMKFRSMVENAESETGAVWAQDDDFRVTFIGKIIRKLRIDELPQLLNILKGEMSLIGPRPERPEFVETLKKEIPYYNLRHVVKPGLTGWAQICYRYGASVEDALKKLQYDLYYIRHLSFQLDLNILFKTLRIVLLGIGAR